MQFITCFKDFDLNKTYFIKFELNDKSQILKIKAYEVFINNHLINQKISSIINSLFSQTYLKSDSWVKLIVHTDDNYFKLQ